MSNGNYEFVGGFQNDQIQEVRHETHWANSVDHRAQIVDMLTAGASDQPAGTLCVWGAGLCNDIDLKVLLRRFHEIHLFDLDDSSMQRGVTFQGVNHEPGIFTWPGVDLSGIAKQLKQFRQQPDKTRYNEIKTLANEHRLHGVKQHDVVVSTCLLSQLVKGLVATFGDAPETLLEPLVTVRNRHLEMMLEHTVPGGTAILITDFTSSDTLPILADEQLARDSNRLQAVIKEALAKQDHFHGLHPDNLGRVIQEHHPVIKQLERLEASDYWIWNGTHRFYACVAIRMTKTDGG